MGSILITQQTYSYKPGSDTTNLGSLSKQISEKENDVFRLITNMGLQKKKILICHEEWNLRLRIPRSDALPLSHRDSGVNKAISALKFKHGTRQCILLGSAMSLASCF